MSRLKQAKPRLGTLGGRLGFGDPDEVKRRQRRIRYASAPWSSWYSSKRWANLRLQILDRDLWTCQQTGVLLRGKWPSDDAPVVDHIKPHRGDPDLFWDPDNLQSVSRKWHDTVKRSIERGGDGGEGGL